jgi:hypothetical protein
MMDVIVKGIEYIGSLRLASQKQVMRNTFLFIGTQEVMALFPIRVGLKNQLLRRMIHKRYYNSMRDISSLKLHYIKQMK